MQPVNKMPVELAEPFPFRTALVTGATGCIGRCLVRKLLASGCYVNVLVRDSSRLHKGLGELSNDSINVVKGDLHDSAALTKAVDEVEVVFHAAGKAHMVPQNRPDKEEFYRVNVEGTRNLLQACRNQNLSAFIYFSTIAVYGRRASTPLTEVTPCRPEGDYAWSKYLAEKTILQHFEGGRRAPTILRLGTVYGEGDRGNFLRMLKGIESGRFIFVGSGETQKSMTYVENVADATIRAAATRVAQGEIYLVADPSPYALRLVVETVARHLNVPVPRWHLPAPLLLGAGCVLAVLQTAGFSVPFTARDVQTLMTDVVCDVSKIHASLGFQPRVGLEEGVARTVRWYRKENDGLQGELPGTKGGLPAERGGGI